MATKEKSKLIIPAIPAKPATPEIPAREIELPLYGRIDSNVFALLTIKKGITIYDGKWIFTSNRADTSICNADEYDRILNNKPYEPITKEEFETALGNAINKILDLNNDK